MAEETVITEFKNDGTIGPTLQRLDKSPELQNKFGGFNSYDDQLTNYKNAVDVEKLALSGLSNTAVAKYLVNNAPTPEGQSYYYEDFKEKNISDDEIIARFSNAPIKSIPYLFSEKYSKGLVEFGLPVAAAVSSAAPAFIGATTLASGTGPAAPFIGAGAAALTAYSAYKATQGIGGAIHKKMFPYETLPSQRALGEAFFTFGSGTPFAFAPAFVSRFMLPGTAAALRNNLVLAQGGKLTPLDQMGTAYLKYPGRVTALEGTSLIGSSYGTFLAEKGDPGNVLKRMGAEVVFGLGSPFAQASLEKLGSKFLDKGRSVFGGPNVIKTQMNPEGYIVGNNALIDQGKRIKKALEKAGEDGDFEKLLNFSKSPEGQKLLEDLYSTLPPNERLKFGPRTTASYLNNKYLLGLQKLLSRQSENFDTNIKNEYIKTFIEAQDVVKLMYASGDASLIAKAAELEVTTMQNLVARSLQTASEKAGNTISKVVGTDTESAMKAGRIIEKLMENTNTDLRAIETSLYDNIDGKTVTGTTNFVEEFDDILAKLLDKEEPLIPLPIRALIFKAKGGSDDLADNTAKEVLKLQTKIKNLSNTNAELNATFPTSATYFSDLQTEIADLTPEMKLVRLQEEITRLNDININQKEINLYYTTLKRHENSLNKKFSPFVDTAYHKEGKIGSIFFSGDGGQGILINGKRVLNSDDPSYQNLSKRDKISILEQERQRRYASAGLQNKKLSDVEIAQEEARDFYDDAIYLLQNEAPVIKSVKDKNKLIRYLENEIKINYNTSLLDDLNNTAPVSPELVDDVINIDEMRRARTLLLNQARISIAASDYDRARILSNLADAIKDDIGYSVTPQDGVPLTPNQIAIKNAVNFSSAYNDVFSRGYPSSILANQKSGARKIMPELLLQSTFSGPGDATALKFKGMRDAIELLSEQGGKRYSETATARLGTLDAAQADFIRAAFDEITIPPAVSGEPVTVDPQALANFNKKYRNLLESFPSIKKDLANIESANNLMNVERINMQNILAQTKLGAKDPNNVPILSFANFLGAETNPGLIIDQQVGSPGARNSINPVKALSIFTQKVVNASKSGKFPGITEGFVDTVLDRGVKFSQMKNGLLDFNGLQEFLFSPITKGQASVIETLRINGAISLPESIRLKNMIDDMVKYTDDLEIDPVSKLPVSITKRGTNLLTTVFSTGFVGLVKESLGLEGVGAGGIAVPAAAAELGKEIVTKIPSAMKVKLLEDAMRDPELFKIMMDKTMDATKQVDNIKFLYGYMVNSGLIAADSKSRKEREKEFRDTKFLEQKRILLERTKNKKPSAGLGSELLNIEDQQSSVQKPPQITPTQVSANLPRPGPTVTTSSPPVSNQPVDRARFASLFPEDRALIEGIGSLV